MSSKKYFVNEFSGEHKGLQSVVQRATTESKKETSKHKGLQSIVQRTTTKRSHKDALMEDTDYHILGASCFNGMPKSKIQSVCKFMKETINRHQCHKIKTTHLTHADVRRIYTEGEKSIYKNMPVPIAIPGGPEYNNFAMLQIERAVTHLLAHGVPLKTLDYNVMSDWKDSNGHFHTLFHEDLFSKIGSIENCPRQLRIHQLYIWSDGFQKNTLVIVKKKQPPCKCL
jgi:hypothetical protein